jgi:hypothetical protein
MHNLRYLKHAPRPGTTSRRRLTLTVLATVLGFVIGVMVPDARMLTGATTAVLAVALLQLVFIITDSKTAQTPPKDPGTPPETP